MLTLKNICLQRGKKVLLDHANARMERQYKVGLVGRNGAGKSSLMAVLTRQAQEDAGTISCDIPQDQIAYLEQSLPPGDLSCIDFVKSGDTQWQNIQQRLQQAEEAENGEAIAECYVELQDIDGFSIDARAATVLHGLGFHNDEITQPIRTFSGGWQMRLQLAKVLLSRAELLLLDEPTNHLDLEAIAWFEQWLQNQSCSVVLISHDRDFLDTVCSHILHLAHQELKLYQGNYTAFLKQYEMDLEHQSKQRESALKKQAHMQKYVDRFRAKASKARQAQSRLKAMAKLNIAPAVQAESPFHFSFFDFEPLSSPIFKMDAQIGYPKKIVFKNVNISLMNQDRIGLIGVNGAGKTTLIKSLVGDLPLLSGEKVQHQKLNIGYFSQQQLDTLDLENSPMGHMRKHFPKIAESEARRFLGGFHFMGDRVFDPVQHFSGGEKARLALALLIYRKPNMLLMDEPTNHLDIQMREALILALQNYAGAVIVVSHDRHFMNSLVDTLWIARDGELEPYQGNLDDYQQTVLDSQDNPKPRKAKSNNELKKLEKQMDSLSKKLKKIETRLADETLYTPERADDLAALQVQHQNTKHELETVEAQWLQASGE